MKHINTLIEKLHIPQNIIDAISADTLPENFDSEFEAYNNSRIEYYKATPAFKALEKQTSDATYNGAVLKYNKRLNKALDLGFTDAELSEMSKNDMDFFIEKTKSFLTDKERKLMSSTDATLKADLETYKQEVSKYATENQDLKSQMQVIKATAEKERDEAINRFKAEAYYHKMVSEDKTLPNTTGQAATLESIMKNIFEKYIVNPDGTLLASDGTQATHPEKHIIMTKLSDIYEYEKNRYGLIIKSNAGAGADGKPGSGAGLSPEIAKRMAELQAARQR